MNGLQRTKCSSISSHHLIYMNSTIFTLGKKKKSEGEFLDLLCLLYSNLPHALKTPPTFLPLWPQPITTENKKQELLPLHFHKS